MKSPNEMAADIASKARAKRLLLNMSQQTLAAASGVSYGTLKKFERTGQISLESLLKIALALDEFATFENLFVQSTNKELPSSIDELFADNTSPKNTRQRGCK